MNMPPWSFSSLAKFETCPRQYYVLKVLKAVKEPPTVHTEWGTKVHKGLEERIRDKTPLPEGLTQFEPYAARFDKFGDRVFVEQKLCLTDSFKLTEWGAKDCWYRSVIDVGVEGKVAYLGDWKTGKVKNDHDQLTLSAVAYMSANSAIVSTRTQYIWLATNKTSTKDFSHEDVPALWNEYLPRVQRMQSAYDRDKWVPKPSGLCRGWCCVGREHCEFWTQKR